MKEILLTHFKRYPLMEPRDAVKLIYQSAFGGGHLVDKGTAEERIFTEWESVRNGAPPPSNMKYEPIGNGFCRAHLQFFAKNELEELSRVFTEDSAYKGSEDLFDSMIEDLRSICIYAPFSKRELEKYLTAYRRGGYQAVSHSDIYRGSYRPAYRIIRQR